MRGVSESTLLVSRMSGLVCSSSQKWNGASSARALALVLFMITHVQGVPCPRGLGFVDEDMGRPVVTCWEKICCYNFHSYSAVWLALCHWILVFLVHLLTIVALSLFLLNKEVPNRKQIVSHKCDLQSRLKWYLQRWRWHFIYRAICFVQFRQLIFGASNVMLLKWVGYSNTQLSKMNKPDASILHLLKMLNNALCTLK